MKFWNFVVAGVVAFGVVALVFLCLTFVYLARCVQTSSCFF